MAPTREGPRTGVHGPLLARAAGMSDTEVKAAVVATESRPRYRIARSEATGRRELALVSGRWTPDEKMRVFPG